MPTNNVHPPIPLCDIETYKTDSSPPHSYSQVLAISPRGKADGSFFKAARPVQTSSTAVSASLRGSP